jgi:DNA-binding transcriptional ArsR family regulator
MSNEMPVDELSRTFSALADPTRRAILDRLLDGEASVNELAEPFPLTLQAVSKHVKVLETAGLITRGQKAQLRPSRIDGDQLELAAAWLGNYREFFEGTFDRLEVHLENVQKKGKKNA